jgi:hypothetical protein
MTDLYLKAADADVLYAALEAAGIVAQGEGGYHVTDAHKYALDVIGTIWKPTGKMLQTEEGEVPEMAPLEGYHANLRVVNGEDSSNLETYKIDVSSPVRHWA